MIFALFAIFPGVQGSPSRSFKLSFPDLVTFDFVCLKTPIFIARYLDEDKR